MKKNTKSKTAAAPKIDPYVDGLMAKLLERLTSLESKTDKILSRVSQPQSSSPAPQPPPPPRRDRVLYEAICADCHKVCEVPFKPSEDRSVYCKECFARRKSGGAPKPFPALTPVAMPSKTSARAATLPPEAPSLNTVSKKAKKKTEKNSKKK